MSSNNTELPSSTFCILPWIHVSTKTNGEMRLCCTTCASSSDQTNQKNLGGKLGVNRNDSGQPANFNSSSLMEGWNNNYMREVRRQMLAGEKPAACAKCFKEEAHGLNSKRNWETEYWRKRIDLKELLLETNADGSVAEKIRYFDLRLGHKCNLRCTMCSPHDSSGWIDDWDQIFPQIENPSLKELMQWPERGRSEGASYDWYKNPEFWKEFDQQIPHLQQLYFAGGEPLLIEEHYSLLERIIAHGRSAAIELRYNSNGTVVPSRILDLWTHFKRVRFGFSLDGFAEKNSYIRYPANWAQIEKNLKTLDQTSDNVEVTLACAVQALNIMYLPEFIEWKLAQNFKKINAWPNSAGLINFHLVYHPAFLNVRILPANVKKMITTKLEAYHDELSQRFSNNLEFAQHPYGIRRLKSLVTFMNGEDWSRRLPEFHEFIHRLDSQRKTSFENTFPELASHLDREAFLKLKPAFSTHPTF